MHVARSARQSTTVDIVTMLLVLAGDHEESANANARALLRLAEPETGRGAAPRPWGDRPIGRDTGVTGGHRRALVYGGYDVADDRPEHLRFL